MLAPTEVSQAAVTGVASIGGAASYGGETENSYGSTVEQVRSYHGWNYVITKKLCELISASAPIVGVSHTTTVPSRYQAVPMTRQSYWNRTFGGLFQTVAANVERLESHPLITLFDTVNPEDTWNDLLYELNMFLELTGCAYVWVLNDDAGLPMQLEVVPTQWCREVRDPNTGIRVSWEITLPGMLTPWVIAPDDIIPFRFKSPLGKLAWTSPTQAVDTWVDSSEAVSESRLAVLKNHGNPSMVLKPDREEYGGDLNDAEARKLQSKVAGRMRDTRKHGVPLLLPPGIDYERWSDTPLEMGHLESDEQLMDALFAARGVSKIICGMTKDMNRSDVEGATVHLCQFTLIPRLRFLAGRLTEKLASRFDPRLKVWFDDPTPASWEEERGQLEIDAMLGSISPDERRESRGRDPWNTPESQTGWISSSMAPLSMPDEDDEDDEDDADGADDE